MLLFSRSFDLSAVISTGSFDPAIGFIIYPFTPSYDWIISWPLTLVTVLILLGFFIHIVIGISIPIIDIFAVILMVLKLEILSSLFVSVYFLTISSRVCALIITVVRRQVVN